MLQNRGHDQVAHLVTLSLHSLPMGMQLILMQYMRRHADVKDNHAVALALFHKCMHPDCDSVHPGLCSCTAVY